MKPRQSFYDVLVIGAGIGGLSCAISAAEKGLSVAVVSKETYLEESNTFHAQGESSSGGNRILQTSLRRYLQSGGLSEQ
jgi:succinate dehydrogenase/fumarate reductase flavoprotein subunit